MDCPFSHFEPHFSCASAMPARRNSSTTTTSFQLPSRNRKPTERKQQLGIFPSHLILQWPYSFPIEDDIQEKESLKALAKKKALLRAKQSLAEANDYQDERDFGNICLMLLQPHLHFEQIPRKNKM
jgi:hypothetical protein